MDLSVIIVSYNVKHFLEQCLRTVARASEDIDCEVFVVDNNSADGSCSMVRMEFPEFRLIMNQNNKGFSAANNQALKLAKGRYVLLLNPDTLVEEDTFRKCISYMEEHPDAGALGVRMINGNGKFLPESKRSLPTPKTAFFKIFGFGDIFPRSAFFNRYYLGHLDSMETTRAEIISGAFMFLRHEAVKKTGLLDEKFFMYGEDIDYSYRLLKKGYTNYYYPDVKIIHFKGESTKKENINTTVNFYKAMEIFVKKHFTNGNIKSLILPVRITIVLIAGLSLLKGLFKKLFLPLTEGIIIYSIYRIVISLWGTYKFGKDYNYPETFTGIIILIYTLITLIAITFFTGYRIPSKINNAFKGVLAGNIFIIIFYAFLPADMRFSRAIILIGGILTAAAIPLWRLLISVTGSKITENPFAKNGKTVIVSNQEGYDRIIKLLSDTEESCKISGRVSINRDDMHKEVLGNIVQLKEIIRINNIKEVIFTTGELSAAQIIDSMHQAAHLNVRLKIASADESYIIGSNYINAVKGIIKLESEPEMNTVK